MTNKEMYVDGLTKALSSSEKIETPKKCVNIGNKRKI